ncbi:GNAT family N-acetyltransferase [Nibrella saemangeumensis]
MIRYTTAATDDDLQQILALQQQNLAKIITPEQQQEQGFVTVVHTLPLLQQMNAAAPQIIAKDGDQLAGYALVMPTSFRSFIPVLQPMFDLLDTLEYDGQLVGSYSYYVMGQICVVEKYRGQGVFDGLYQYHRDRLSADFDLCVTEVATRNTRSLRAHQRVGFTSIAEYEDETDRWCVIVWDWR